MAPTTRSAEWWAREVFEGAPALLRRLLVLGWRFGLGLRLAPPAPASNVMGWAIVTSEPAKAVLGVGSRWLTARVVVLVEDDRVLHITLVRFDRAPARQLWMLAKPIHELVIPFLLTRAAARAQGRSSR
jgi:hypothetical protein